MTLAPAPRRTAASPRACGRRPKVVALAAALTAAPASAASADRSQASAADSSPAGSAGAGAPGPSDSSAGSGGAAGAVAREGSPGSSPGAQGASGTSPSRTPEEPLGAAGAAGPSGSPEGAGASDSKAEGPADDKAAGPADSKAASGGATAGAGSEAAGKGPRPPRVDGVYFGGTLAAGLSAVRVNDFPTPDPFPGGGATLRVGEVVYPWMSVGVEIAGNWAYRFAEPRQRQLQGAFLIDFGFYPVPRIPLSLRAGFGAGGGAIREQGRSARSGFGGAVFTAAVRYEIFPLAAKKRPKQGGGFSIGPELGWIGFMPAAKGRPMAHTVYLGLFMGFYFGS